MNALTSCLTVRIWPRIAFLISLSMLCSAWAFQYIGGMAPCQMCYWQRHGHKAVLIVSLLAIALSLLNRTGTGKTLSAQRGDANPAGRLLLWLIALAFAVSAGLGLWHMGVEYGWWEGPKTCMVTPIGEITMEDFQNSLNEPIKMPACSEVAWSMLGLSMAGWNALVSAAAMLMSLYVAARKGT